jgi:mono/diheme cytochrome c family protein
MSRTKRLVAWVGLGALCVAAYVGIQDRRAVPEIGTADGPLTLSGTPLERGRYLAAAADCTACHSVPGGVEFAGGVAFTLPFGTLYSSNLTPDVATGIGAWTDEEFVTAVRTGRGRGGKHLYPAHPYTSYAGMARNDVLAIKAYLDSLPATASTVPANRLPFPLSQRGWLAIWNAAYRPSTVGYSADAAHDPAWNRGAYLANALGHCGECHTPRNPAYALQRNAALSGAVTGGWNAYDITAQGLAQWSAADLDAYLANGRAPHHGIAAGPMQAVVAFDTGRLAASDRADLVHYLRGGRAESGTVPATLPASVAEPGTLGAQLYAGACRGCHGDTDSVSAAGSLAGASSARDPHGTNLLRLLALGSGHGSDPRQGMPAYGAAYSDAERAALANYVLAQWGGRTPALTARDAQRAALP